MCNIFNYFYEFFTSTTISISDKIQVISILSALFVSVVSIIISIISLIQTQRIFKEGQLAYISIFPHTAPGMVIPSIKIQNFGNLPARIIGITTDCDEINSSDSIFCNPFKHYKNCSVAPNQYFTNIFCTEDGSGDVPHNNFNVTIKYKTSKKTITETFLMNFDFLESRTYSKQGNAKTPIDALNHISQNIYSLVQK